MNSNAVLRLQTLRVRDVMNPAVVNVSASQPMADVAEAFASHGVSSAPVVDEQGRCVGILSAADFLHRERARSAAVGIGSGAAPTTLTADENGGPLHIEPRPADSAYEYMSKSVQSIASDAPLLTAAKVMCAEHIHHLPVLDESERPIGVVSTMDIVSALLGVIDEMYAAKR